MLSGGAAILNSSFPSLVIRFLRLSVSLLVAPGTCIRILCIPCCCSLYSNTPCGSILFSNNAIISSVRPGCSSPSSAFILYRSSEPPLKSRPSLICPLAMYSTFFCISVSPFSFVSFFKIVSFIIGLLNRKLKSESFIIVRSTTLPFISVIFSVFIGASAGGYNAIMAIAMSIAISGIFHFKFIDI